VKQRSKPARRQSSVEAGIPAPDAKRTPVAAEAREKRKKDRERLRAYRRRLRLKRRPFSLDANEEDTINYLIDTGFLAEENSADEKTVRHALAEAWVAIVHAARNNS